MLMSMSRSEGNTFLCLSLLNLPSESTLFAFLLQKGNLSLVFYFSFFRLFLAEDIFLEMEVLTFLCTT